MRKLIMFLVMVFAASCVFGETNYVVTVSEDGTREISGYPTTNTIEQIKAEELSTAVVVIVTKAEYEADKDVPEEDRLKNIDAKKIADAVKAYPAEKAGEEWDDDPKLRTGWKASGGNKASWIAARTNETSAVVSP